MSTTTQMELRGVQDQGYTRYTGLGGFDPEPDGIFTYLPQIENLSISDWREFLSPPVGALKLLTVYELISSYNSINAPDEFTFGSKIFMLIRKNEELFRTFIDRWFDPEPDSNFFFYPPLYTNFKGLNFSSEFCMRLVEKEYHDSEGNITRVKFKDGSMLRMLTKEVAWRQFYVLSTEYLELNFGYAKLHECFK